MTSYTSEIVVGSAIVAALGVAAYIVAQSRPQDEKLRKLEKELMGPRSELESSRQPQVASPLHAKAWGKPWPQSEGTISKTEISGESGSVDDDDEVDGALTDKLEVPPLFNYRYFKEIQGLKRALGASPGPEFEDVLVVREEYEMLRQALEGRLGENHRDIV